MTVPQPLRKVLTGSKNAARFPVFRHRCGEVWDGRCGIGINRNGRAVSLVVLTVGLVVSLFLLVWLVTYTSSTVVPTVGRPVLSR